MMIPQQELRIGNWVMTDTSGTYYQIKSGADIDGLANSYCLIPITPELLNNCGFDFHNYFKLWQKNKAVSGGPDMELDRDYWILDFSHQRIGVELKSLHQLQNVYFFLRGKELPVTMPEVSDSHPSNPKEYML